MTYAEDLQRSSTAWRKFGELLRAAVARSGRDPTTARSRHRDVQPDPRVIEGPHRAAVDTRRGGCSPAAGPRDAPSTPRSDRRTPLGAGGGQAMVSIPLVAVTSLRRGWRADARAHRFTQEEIGCLTLSRRKATRCRTHRSTPMTRLQLARTRPCCGPRAATSTLLFTRHRRVARDRGALGSDWSAPISPTRHELLRPVAAHPCAGALPRSEFRARCRQSSTSRGMAGAAAGLVRRRADGWAQRSGAHRVGAASLDHLLSPRRQGPADRRAVPDLVGAARGAHAGRAAPARSDRGADGAGHRQRPPLRGPQPRRAGAAAPAP